MKGREIGCSKFLLDYSVSIRVYIRTEKLTRNAGRSARSPFTLEVLAQRKWRVNEAGSEQTNKASHCNERGLIG